MDNTEEQGVRFHLINISLGFANVQIEDKPGTAGAWGNSSFFSSFSVLNPVILTLSFKVLTDYAD